MERPSSSTKHGTYALPVEPVAAEVLPRRSEWECDCSGQAWGACCWNVIESCGCVSTSPDFTANLCCLPCICFTFFGGARIAGCLSTALVSMCCICPAFDLILIPLYYCKLVMTGSNSELIRARIFWCRYLCCRCCCKRFNIDSKADSVIMEYGTKFHADGPTCPSFLMFTSFYETTLTSAAAIHAFVLGYPSDICNCGDCSNFFPHSSGPQPFASYLNVYMLLRCGANPNLQLGSDYLQRDVTNQTPLHLVASRLRRGRKRSVPAVWISSQPWWDRNWISFAKHWCAVSERLRVPGFHADYGFQHNHPIDVCGYASYYLRKMSIGYCCCYPPCCSGAGAGSDMPYDLVTTTNLHAAELLIRYGADASLLDSNGRTPLETVDDADIRGRLQQVVDAVAAGRASREKEVAAETVLPIIINVVAK